MATRESQTNQQFIEKYLEFCQSPLCTEADIREDLAELLHVPGLAHLAFADTTRIRETLICGLEPLFLENPDTGRIHRIGQFVVYITRYREYPVWVSTFRLVNLYKLQYGAGGNYFHPHMTVQPDPEIGEIARICISRGREPILQYIRQGRMSYALTLIQNLLHSLGPDVAFCDIMYWPYLPKGDYEDVHS
jgi:hypothetical protein